MNNPDASIVIERELKAPVERVFSAWTDPTKLCRWFRASEALEIASVDVDLQVGGMYRIVLKDPEDTMVVFGRYTKIDAPHLLEFTWQWEVSSLEPGETLVLLELFPHVIGTLMRLTHSRFSTERSHQAHDKGWNGVLATLTAFVESEDPS
jgi:uncharacterized protein YndB with AHSA1/START domain